MHRALTDVPHETSSGDAPAGGGSLTTALRKVDPLEVDGSVPGGRPLVVDVDGTLTRSDLLWEGLLDILVRHPLKVLSVLRAASQGKCALKEIVARDGADVVPE